MLSRKDIKINKNQYANKDDCLFVNSDSRNLLITLIVRCVYDTLVGRKNRTGSWPAFYSIDDILLFPTFKLRGFPVSNYKKSDNTQQHIDVLGNVLLGNNLFVIFAVLDV